jgi:hypothetical protein
MDPGVTTMFEIVGPDPVPQELVVNVASVELAEAPP